MGKITKNTLKAIQNRNRVALHRAWTSIQNSDRNQHSIVFSNSSTSENNSTDFQTTHIRESLRRWVLKFNISKRAVNDLLNLLISFGFKSLPRDSRSLLTTPRSVELKSVTNGKIW